MQTLAIDRSGDTAVVRLSRPERRNAISFAMLRELLDCARQLRGDRRLRAVILAGEGESFSSGIDLADLADPRHRWLGIRELLRPGPSLFQRAFLAWRELPVPVIAVLHGHCFGAGMQLALAADLRISHPEAQLSIMKARWGLVPDMGLTCTLRGLVCADVAKELTMSARIIEGRAAHDLGLVTHLDADPMQRARDLAAEFATRSPDAVLAAKRIVDAMQGSVAHGLRMEKRWQLRLLRGRNVAVARRRASTPDAAFEPRQFE